MVRSRIFLYALISFLCGVAFRSFFAIPVEVAWICALAATTALVFGIVHTKKMVAVYALFVLLFCIGIVRFWYEEKIRPDLSMLYGKETALEGVIEGEPEVTEKTQRIVVRVERLGARELPLSFLLLAVGSRYPHYTSGEKIRILGMIEEPQQDEDFDEKTYLARDSIFALTLFPSIKKINMPSEKSVRSFLTHIKNGFEEKLEDTLVEPQVSLLKGLLLGDKGGLPQDIRDQFRRTGTSHILALSGYNITLIGRFMMTALLAIGVTFLSAFWIASFSIIIFVFMTGTSASAVRAGIMGILLLVAQQQGRLYSIRNALAAAASLMVFQNPLLLRFDIGFQLSFVATLGLAYVAPFIDRHVIGRYARKIERQHNIEQEEIMYFPSGEVKTGVVRTTLVETLAAQCAVLPLLIWYFGEVSLISPLVNLLILLIVPYAMGFGFAAGLASFLFIPFAKIIGWIAWFPLSYLLWVSKVAGNIPFALIRIPRWTAAGIALIFILVVWYGRVRRRQKRKIS